MAVTSAKDLVHETSTSTGTGNFTTTAVNGKQRFSDAAAFGTGVSTDVFDYFISNRDVAGEWERGTGHMSAVGTLVRDTVVLSSNANAAVSFTAGTKDITNDVPAQQQTRVFSLHGAGRLTKSGANLLFAPCSGNAIVINGVNVTIPDAGVTVAPPATSGTLYYIYAFLSSGTLTLEASITTHATQAGTGVEIKSGDATRTLVGMARTLTNAWVDGPSQRFVLSYFNRRSKRLFNTFAAARSLNAAVLTEVNTEIRCEFLMWADEDVTCSLVGSASSDTANTVIVTDVGFDGASLVDSTRIDVVSAGNDLGVAAIKSLAASEGYHYASLYTRRGGTSCTITYEQPTQISGIVRG